MHASVISTVSGKWQQYSRWLHTRWPAGTVEPLPVCDEHGRTNVPGLRIVGDLTGIPLLKFASDSGARAVQDLLQEPSFLQERKDDLLDLAIVGAGIGGISAAIEARRAGLRFAVFEATEPFSTIVNFPKAKPIYTYPSGMRPSGGLQFTTDVKEALVEEIQAQRTAAQIEPEHARITRVVLSNGTLELRSEGNTVAFARRVIVSIGRSGNFRKLDVTGESLPKVYNRLHDPNDFAGKNVLVVGGGDSALETAIALTACGATVTLSYRGKEFSRPKPENTEKLQMLVRDPGEPVQVEHPTSERVNPAMTAALHGRDQRGALEVLLESHVEQITEDSVLLRDSSGQQRTLPNDAVFTMIGREAPLKFFRDSGVRIRGEWSPLTWLSFVSFFAFAIWLYLWKANTSLNAWWQAQHWFPFNLENALEQVAPFNDPKHLLGTLWLSVREPDFYYSTAYCLVVLIFGLRRMRRRPTPYIRRQTWTLIAIQCIPLFLLPIVLLPWAGHNGWFDHGTGKQFADALFPIDESAHGREYWRAYGLILAWPLFVWNVFTSQPMGAWLVISFIQTFVLIPLIVWRWGKGAYCGWICSCGALAETLGDQHRQKMPHGPFWNRLNMTGQVILGIALLLLVLRILGWISQLPHLGFLAFADSLHHGLLSEWAVLGVQLNYYHAVDIFLAGIIGVGLYFWFSGRVWCRFACPLAALMHIYARFSRFRIFAEKKKCISCNVCTSVCHQGIDVMNFANKGLPMEDPECVRCSACVTECPTGVLAFGRFDGAGVPILDRVVASPVRAREAEAQR